MLKRLKYGLPLSILLLITSRYITEVNSLSISLLLLSIFTMAFALSEEVIKQRCHIKFALILLFVLLILAVSGLLLPLDLDYGGVHVFQIQIYAIMILMVFIAISFVVERVMLYIKIKIKE